MLPRCLAAVEGRGRRDRDRRHRLDRPHGRDRPLVRRARDRARVDGFLLGRAQHVLRRRDGDWVMYLDADEVLVAEDVAKLRDAHGSHLARGVLPGRDQLHRRAGRRHRPHPQRAARLPQPARVPLRGPPARADRAAPARRTHRSASSRPRSASSTTAISAACATRREKSRRNIELLRAQQAESAPTPFLHFNLGSEYAAVDDAPAALAEFERAWEMIESDPEGGSVRVHADAGRRGSSRRCASAGVRADAIARADDGLQPLPGLHRPRARAGVRVTRPRSRGRRVAHCSTSASRWATPPARYTATLGCGTYLPRLSLAELDARSRRPAQRPRAARLVPRGAPRLLRHRPSVRVRPC